MIGIARYELIEILVSGKEILRGSYFTQHKAHALADAWALSRVGAITKVDYVEWSIGEYDNGARKTVWHSQRNR